MEPETHEPFDRDPHSEPLQKPDPAIDPVINPDAAEGTPPSPGRPAIMSRIFLGPQGLRAGWSTLIFVAIYILAAMATGAVLFSLHLINRNAGGTPLNMSLNEFIMLVALLAAASVIALIERRRLVDYNLTGLRRVRHFFSGVAIGFVALSILVGGLRAGGWLHMSGPTLSAGALASYALVWGCIFIVVGLVEEGIFRCYLLYTFTRGMNFWWALTLVAGLCAELALRHKGNGVWGDYAAAMLGLLPCFWLHIKQAPRASFWYAAWATSTLFGFVHTGNGGENWVGIFSAAAVGFVFCVSVYVTGSAWWAIGCHAAWDWAETYFYGTADSGMVAKGHMLSSAPSGNHLWSGGADGPEGSLLILAILALLLAWLVVVCARRSPVQPVSSMELPTQ